MASRHARLHRRGVPLRVRLRARCEHEEEAHARRARRRVLRRRRPFAGRGALADRNPDSGAFSPAGERPAPPAKDAGGPLVDAGGDRARCSRRCSARGARGRRPRDRRAAHRVRAGSGDDGEWVEIRSTRSCWLKVKGCRSSLRAARLRRTRSRSPRTRARAERHVHRRRQRRSAKNHGLPGKVFAWDASTSSRTTATRSRSGRRRGRRHPHLPGVLEPRAGRASPSRTTAPPTCAATGRAGASRSTCTRRASKARPMPTTATSRATDGASMSVTRSRTRAPSPCRTAGPRDPLRQPRLPEEPRRHRGHGRRRPGGRPATSS